MMLRSTLSLAVVFLAGSVVVADDLKSGPPVGAANDRRGFRPQFVTGPSAGKPVCPV